MKILILGAGGIGGYFGAHLIRVGADVTYLLREKRKTLIDDSGLRVESPHGNFTVHPNAVTAATVGRDYDLIVLAPKAFDLDDALKSLDGALGDAVVLPFLNGLDHFDVLDEKLGREHVMGGVAHIAATMKEDGTVQQLSDIHMLTVGPRHVAHEDLAKDFVAICGTAAFKSALSDDIEQVLWDKWVFLATLAGMTTLCRATVGEIVATPYGKAAMEQMYEECCSVASAFNRSIGEPAKAKALDMLTAQGSTFTASMLRDLLAGQRTEYEHILGGLIRKGERFGCEMSLLRLAHTHMAIQAMKNP